MVVAAALVPRAASAATSLVLPAAGGLGALSVSVDPAGKVLRYATCSSEPCATSASSETVAMAVGDAVIDPKRVTVDDVAIGRGRHLARIRVAFGAEGEPESPAWEALVVAGSPPLFAGVTGWTHGEPGERHGVDIRLLPEQGRTFVLIGEIREDLRICGDDATLLDPRALDPATMQFHGATLQRLSAARRDGATAIVATPHHGPADMPLARLLRATEATSALPRAPATALTDGDPATVWSEGRSGRGQGELVLLRMPFDVPVVRFSITPAPALPVARGAAATPTVAPETFYLATGAGTYEVTLPEDAATHPGESYDIVLPEPLKTSCVALVLEGAFTHGKAHPDVSVAELTAYSAFDHAGAALADVASALNGGDARATAAAGVLEQAGEAGIVAIAPVYPGLSPAGRALAMNVASSTSNCEASASLFTAALSDPDEVVRAKAASKLGEPTCGRAVLPALIASLKSETTRAKIAPVVAAIGREKALGALAEWLGDGSADDRHVLRASVAFAARNAASGELKALLAGAAKKSPAASLDALRALRDRLTDVQSTADASIGALAAGNSPLEVRYQLVDVVALLAMARDSSAQLALEAFVLRDAAPEVRARAAEQLAATREPITIAARALEDGAPRVREAALLALGAIPRATATSTIAALLTRDPWTFVRVAAAASLAHVTPTDASDHALGESLTQLSPRVREQAVLALEAHGSVAYRDVIRKHLTDLKEDLPVRVASAHAAGALCDAKSIDVLTHLALAGASSADANEVTLGLVATDALGAIHPKDLPSRFEKLHAEGMRPDARAAGARALEHPGTCRLP